MWPATQGLAVKSYLFLLHKVLGKGLMGQGENWILPKRNFGKVYSFFCKKTRFSQFCKFTYANACAVQIQHGTNKIVEYKLLKNLLLAKRIKS